MYTETDFTKLPYTEEEFIAAVGERVEEVHRKIDSVGSQVSKSPMIYLNKSQIVQWESRYVGE